MEVNEVDLETEEALFPGAGLAKRCCIGTKDKLDQTIRELADSDLFESVLADMLAMHNRKRQDYGTDSDPYANVRTVEEFGIEPWLGAILKCSDKMTRLKSFAKKRRLANEGVEDSLLDNAVYSVIALVLWREQAAKGTPNAQHAGHDSRQTVAAQVGSEVKAPRVFRPVLASGPTQQNHHDRERTFSDR